MSSIVGSSVARLSRHAAKRARVGPPSVAALRHASSAFRMPAMSPTMTEGGIASWKFKPGEAFSAGDVLLEIETDKATIDVEAQDDGVMGKILAKDGSSKVPVGQVIAMLAEEGDDISAIEVPSDLAPEGASSSASASKSDDSSSKSASSSSSSSGEGYAEKTSSVKPGPEGKTVNAGSESAGKAGVAPGQDASGHAHESVGNTAGGKPLFPSVMRLLTESGMSRADIEKLAKKGTGRHGMLTKGDVLFALGKAKSARGTASKLQLTKYGVEGGKAAETTSTTPPEGKKEPALILDGAALRRLILGGLEKATKPVLPISSATNALTAATAPAGISEHDFDAAISDYSALFAAPPSAAEPAPQGGVVGLELLEESKGAGSAGLAAPAKPQRDEWEGLF